MRNTAGENLGHIEELMIDLESARVAYAVISFGGILGLGDKLFAVPFSELLCDGDEEEFILNIAREKLEDAPGFDKQYWPDTADRQWGESIHRHYGVTPYWSAE